MLRFIRWAWNSFWHVIFIIAVCIEFLGSVDISKVKAMIMGLPYAMLIVGDVYAVVERVFFGQKPEEKDLKNDRSIEGQESTGNTTATVEGGTAE